MSNNHPTPAPSALFPLGKVYQTRSIAEFCAESERFFEFIFRQLQRHVRLDSPDLCTEDQHTNRTALQTGARIFTAYNLPPEFQPLNTPDPKIWIITESDRSATTILFPSEY